MDCSTLSFPVLHYLPEFAQSHVHWWRRQWHPTPVLLPGKSHGRRSLLGCSPWGHEESDTTERLHFHFSLSCIGEGNGNPLQCSCLENPRDGGAWWAAIYGVAQSRTRLERLSCSNSKQRYCSQKYNLFSELFLNVNFTCHCLLNRNPVRIGAKVRVVIPMAHRRKRSSRSNGLSQPVTPNQPQGPGLPHSPVGRSLMRETSLGQRTGRGRKGESLHLPVEKASGK